MRKVLSVFLMMCGVLFATAQTTTLTFTGRDANNHFIPLDRVVISNLTKGWTETITYPDTILVMSSVGIDDYDGIKEFQLSQNVPNPFDGSSDFSLCLPQSGKVTLEVNDLNGKKITSYSNELPAGCHVFRVLLSTPQSYVLTARCSKDFATIKMVNKGSAGINELRYIGEGNMRTLSVELNNAKGQSQHPFTIGDLMEYVGYANINGIEEESQRIQQLQESSQTFILQFSGTQVQLATSSTDSITNVTQNSATCYSRAISDGGASVTARGVCWSTSQNPTIADNHTTDGSGTGSFISSMTGLSAGTTYYVRAYATNSVGTAYGNQVNYTTMVAPVDGMPCPGAATITDIDNNTYNTVQIGSQCWMKENLRTTKYADGTSISLGSSTSTTTDYRYYPNNDSSNVSTYGYLYNWPAVMGNSSSSEANPSGVQGICPTGWHVPSDAEWTQLENYVSSQSEYVCGNYIMFIAKALASTTGWNGCSDYCAIGNNPSANNATGFSAVPAGCYNGYYNYFSSYAGFWSATQNDSNGAYYRYLFYNLDYVFRLYYNKDYGFSVRCLRD